MDRWQSLVEREIEKLQKAGGFDNLPGTGKPLNLNNDPHLPSDMRLAYKIMKEHDAAPEWITLAKELDTLEKQLRNKLNQATRAYQQSIFDPSLKELDRQNIETRWQSTQQSFKKQSDDFNKKVNSYNLKKPNVIAHRHLFIIEQEVAKLLRS